MPRKSAKLRLSQAEELYKSYSDEGMTESKGGRFIRDMIARLSRGRGLSKGQRNWLDSLIEEGVPQPKGDQVLLAKIDQAIETPGMERRRDILSDFRRKVFNGWNLSPKQTQWLSSMIADAETLRIEGPWTPNEEQLQDMRDIAALSRGYNSVYWSTHGGTWRAVEKIRAYLEVLDKGTLEARVELAPIALDEWCINKAKKAMAGRIRELRKKPYVVMGDLVWTRYRDPGALWNEPYQWFRAPVCGSPEISEKGEVVYPVLNPVLGLIMVTNQQIAKRKPKGA